MFIDKFQQDRSRIIAQKEFSLHAGQYLQIAYKMFLRVTSVVTLIAVYVRRVCIDEGIFRIPAFDHLVRFILLDLREAETFGHFLTEAFDPVLESDRLPLGLVVSPARNLADVSLVGYNVE